MERGVSARPAVAPYLLRPNKSRNEFRHTTTVLPSCAATPTASGTTPTVVAMHHDRHDAPSAIGEILPDDGPVARRLGRCAAGKFLNAVVHQNHFRLFERRIAAARAHGDTHIGVAREATRIDHARRRPSPLCDLPRAAP